MLTELIDSVSCAVPSIAAGDVIGHGEFTGTSRGSTVAALRVEQLKRKPYFGAHSDKAMKAYTIIVTTKQLPYRERYHLPLKSLRHMVTTRTGIDSTASYGSVRTI